MEMAQHLEEQRDQRIGAIDALRGFAVLGICLVNIPEMMGNGIAFQANYAGFDAFIRLLYDMFVQTKFYTLFAFLFGLSFYLFMQRAEQKEQRPYRLMTRRLLLLLLVGIGHGVLLWFGDILHAYALVGLLLLPFYKRAASTIAAWSLSLLGLAAVIIAGSTAIVAAFASEASDLTIFASWPGLAERADYMRSDGLANMILMLPEILGLFLLGLYAGRRGWFTSTGLSNRVLVRALWIAATAAVVMLVPMALEYAAMDSYNTNLVYPYVYLSGKALAVVYACAITLLWRTIGSSRFRGLQAVGRMAFTNYLAQTIVTVLIFQVFWVREDWPMWASLGYSIILFAVQMTCSRLWLNRYRMGPLEWLWRAGTYGKRASVTGSGPGTGSGPTTMSTGS